MSETHAPDPLRVAIVGQGPKGTFALERLIAHGAGLDPARRVEVDLFEPHGAPGAGPVYDPLQPEYLRMNFPAGRIDMWSPSNPPPPLLRRLSFPAWMRQRGSVADEEDYPARALVGRYLTEGHQSLIRHAPSQLQIELHGARVQSIRRRACRWEVCAAGSCGLYDELLIATGHETSTTAGLGASWEHSSPLLPTVFPVLTQSSRGSLSASSTVGVRGFGLSFIDAAIALTEGRGGHFERLEHPFRLRYLPGEKDVALILPFSRTGRPMLPKPTAAMDLPRVELQEIGEAARMRILALPVGFGFEADLVTVIAETAAVSLRLANRKSRAGEGIREASGPISTFLLDASAGRGDRYVGDPVEEIERALAVGAGLRAPDAAWAIGHSWRVLYSALVTRLGGDGLPESDWPSFHALARAMERVAFGPAPLNAAKLLALLAARRLDLSHVRGGWLTSVGARTMLHSSQGACELDAVLDAVLPGPGVGAGGTGMLQQLVSEGHARIARGRRGLDVTADGNCLGSSGAPTGGLSAIGRPTEDSVIGNDTLDRSLHPLADRWARRVIARCTAPAPASVPPSGLIGAGV